MGSETLSLRALNRATLARQSLLERTSLPVTEMVARLVGLQAQNPLDPYLALWSRLEPFDPDALGAMLEARVAVRIVAQRGTIHLLTVDDAIAIRPLMQPVLDAEIARHSEFSPHLVGVDVAPVMTFVHALLTQAPLSGTKLRAAIAERFPDLHPAALAYAARCVLPLVQAPPRGVWGRSGEVRSAPLDTWTGRPLAAASIDDLIVRYLAAFGPSTVGDATTWCRLTGLRDVFERLRPTLRTYRDERGRELFDVPDGMRPHPDVPAPVRLLPEYDNVLLSHSDRSRFAAPDASSLSAVAGVGRGAVLVDGIVRGLWSWAKVDRGVEPRIEVAHLRLTERDAAAVSAEAHRLGQFVRSTPVDVRLTALD